MATNKKKKILMLMGATAAVGGATAVISQSNIFEMKKSSINELNEFLRSKKLLGNSTDIKSVIENNNWAGSPLSNYLRHRSQSVSNVYASNTAAKPKYATSFKTHNNLYAMGRVKTMRFSIPFQSIDGGQKATFDIRTLNVLNSLNQFVSYDFKGLYVNEVKVNGGFDESVKANKIIQNGEMGNWHKTIDYSEIVPKHALFHENTNVDVKGTIHKIEVEIALDNADFIQDVVIDQGDGENKGRDILLKTEDGNAFTLDKSSAGWSQKEWAKEESIFSQNTRSNRLTKGDLEWKPVVQAGDLFIDDSAVQDGYVRVYKDDVNSKWRTSESINSSRITEVTSGILAQEKLPDFTENDITNIVKTSVSPKSFNELDFKDTMNNLDISIQGNDGFGKLEISDKRLQGFAEITSSKTKKVYYREIDNIDKLNSKDDVKLYLSPKPRYIFNNKMDSFIKEFKIRDLDVKFNKDDIKLDIVSHFTSRFTTKNSLESMGSISEIRLNRLGLGEHTKISRIKVLDTFNHEVPYQIKDIRSLNSVDKAQAEYTLQSSNRKNSIQIDQDPKNFNKDFGLTLKLLNTTRISSIQIFRDSLNPINISLKNEDNIRYTAKALQIADGGVWKRDTKPSNLTGHELKKFQSGGFNAQANIQVFGNSEMNWNVVNDDAIIERTGGLDSFGEITDMWMNFYPSYNRKGLTLTELKYYGSQANPEESWTELDKKAKYPDLKERKAHFKINNFEALTGNLELSKWAHVNEYNNIKIAEDFLYNNTPLDGTKASNNGRWPLWWYDRGHDVSQAFLTTHISVLNQNMQPGMQLSTIGVWGELWGIGKEGNLMDLIIKTKDNRIFKLIKGQEWYRKSKSGDLTSAFLSTTKKYKWVEMFSKPGAILAPIKNVWGNDYIKNLTASEELVWEFRFEGEQLWRNLSNYVFHSYKKKIFLRAHRRKVLFTKNNKQIWREKLFDDGSKYTKEFGFNFTQITGLSKQQKVDPTEMRLKDKIYFSGTNGKGILNGINSLKEKYDIQYIVNRAGTKTTYDSVPVSLRNGDEVTIRLKPKAGSDILFVNSKGLALSNQSFEANLGKIDTLAEAKLTHLKNIPSDGFKITGSNFHGHFSKELHDQLVSSTYDTYYYITRNGQRKLISINVLPTNFRNGDILEIIAIAKEGFYFENNGSKDNFKKSIFKKEIKGLVAPKAISNITVPNDFVEESNKNGFTLSKNAINEIKQILKNSSIKIVAQGKDNNIEDITDSYETHIFKDGDIIKFIMTAKDGFYFKNSTDPNKLTKVVKVSRKNMNFKKALKKVDSPSGHIITSGVSGEAKLSFENKWLRQLYQNGLDFWFVVNGKKLKKNELPTNLKNGDSIEIITKIQDKNKYAWSDGSSSDIKHSFQIHGLRENHDVTNPNIRIYERTKNNWRNIITGPSENVRVIPGVAGAQKTDKVSSKIIHKNDYDPAELKKATTLSITGRAFSMRLKGGSHSFTGVNDDSIYGAVAQALFTSASRYERMKSLMKDFGTKLQNISIQDIENQIRKTKTSKAPGYWEYKFNYSMFTWSEFKTMANSMNLKIHDMAKFKKNFNSINHWGFLIKINGLDLSSSKPKINLRIEMNNDGGYNDVLAISNLEISLKDKNKKEVFKEKWDKMMVWDSSAWVSRNGKHPSFLTPDTKKKKVAINQKDLISGTGKYEAPGGLIKLNFLDNNFIIQKKWLFGAIDRNYRSMKNGDWLAIAAETSDTRTTAINDKGWFVQMKHIGELLKKVPLTDFPNTDKKMLVRGINNRGFIVGSLWDLTKIDVKITLNGKVYHDPTDPGLTSLKNGDDLLVEVTPKKGFAFFGKDGIPLKNQTISFHKIVNSLKDNLDAIDEAKVTDDFIDLPKLIQKLKSAIHYDVDSQKFILELSLSDVAKDISKLTPEQQAILKKIKFFARYNGKQIKASLLELIKGLKITMNDVKPGTSISIIVMPDQNSQFLKNGKIAIKSKELIKDLELKPEYFPKILAKDPEFKIREIEIVGVEGKGSLSPNGEFINIVNDKRVLKRYIIVNSKKEYEDLFEEVNGVKVLKSNIDPKRWVDKLPTNFRNGQFVLAKISVDPNYKSPNGQRLYMIGKPNPKEDFILIGQEVSDLRREVETPDSSLLRDSNPQFNNTGLVVVKTSKDPKNYIDEVELKVAPKFIEAINKIIRKHPDFKFELLLKKFNKASGIVTEETLEVVYNKDGTIKEVRIHTNKLDSSDDTLTLSIRILSNHAFNIDKQFNAASTKEDFGDQLNYKDVSIKDIKVNGKPIIPIIDISRSEMDKTKARLTSPFVDNQQLRIENIKKMIRLMYKKYIDENKKLPTEHAKVNLIITDKNGKQKYVKLDILKAMDIMNQNEDALIKIGELLNANVAGSHLEEGDQISLEIVIPPTDKREFKYFDKQNVKHHGKTMKFKIAVVETSGSEHDSVPKLLTKLPQPDLPRDLKFKNVNHRFNGKGIIDDKLTNLWKPRPHQKLYYIIKNKGADPEAKDKDWKDISSLSKDRKWRNGDRLYLKLVADDGFAFETSHGNLFERVIISKVIADSLNNAIKVPNLDESKAFDWSKSFSSSPGHKILNKNNPLENFFSASEREKVGFEWKIIHADGSFEIVSGDEIYNKKLSNGDKLAWRILVKKQYLNQNGSSWVIFKDMIGQKGVTEISGGATNWGDNAEVNVPKSDQIIEEFKRDIFNKLGFNFIVDKKNGNYFKFARNPFDLIPLNTDEKQHLHLEIAFIGLDGKKHIVRINYGDTLNDINNKISILGVRSKSEVVIKVVAEDGVSFLKKGTTLLKKTIEFKIDAFHHVVKTKPILINGMNKIPENLGITGVDGEGKIDSEVLKRLKEIYDKATQNGLTVSLIVNRVSGKKVVAINDWQKFIDEINRKGFNNKDAIGISIDIGQNISKSFSIDGQDPAESFSKQFYVRGLKHLVNVTEKQINIHTPKDGVSGFAKGTIDLKGITQDIRNRFNVKVYKIILINGKEKKQEVLNWENGVVLKNNEVIQIELIAKEGNVFRNGQDVKTTIIKRIKISGLKHPITAPKFPKNLVFHKKDGKIVDVNIETAGKSNILITATMKDGTVKEFHSKKEFIDALNNNISPTDIAKIKYKLTPINNTTDALVDANGNVLGSEANSNEFVFGGNIHVPDQAKLDGTKGALKFNKKTSTGTINLAKVFKSNDPKKPYSTIKIGVMRRSTKDGKWEEVMEVLPADFNKEIKLEAGFEYKFVPRYINKADKDKFFITDTNDDAIFKVNLLDKINFVNKPTFSKLIIVGEKNAKHIINKNIILGISKEKIKYIKVCVNGKVINNIKDYKGIKNGDVITVEVVLKKGNRFKANSSEVFMKSLKVSGLEQNDSSEQYSKFPWISVSVSLGLITLFGAGAGFAIFKKRKKK